MVRVPILIREGASRFFVSVQARSIRRAVEIAKARYPGADVRVNFPIDRRRSSLRSLAHGSLGLGVSSRNG